MVATGVSIKERLASVQGVRMASPLYRSDDHDFAGLISTTEAENEDAELVLEDGTDFLGRSVPEVSESGFELFLDGVQESAKAFYAGMYTGRLANIAAGVFERKGQSFEIEPVCAERKLMLYAPDGEVSQKLQGGEWCLVPMTTDEKLTDAAYDQEVMRQLSADREALECLVASWAGDRWMAVDGSIAQTLIPLAHFRGRGDQGVRGQSENVDLHRPDGVPPSASQGKEGKSERLVGLVKSHRHQYFRSRARVEAILNLRAGERTTLFIRPGRDGLSASVYSCYLKLHESTEESPLFGVIRVEVPATPESIAKIDEICGWVLAERYPIAFPERRADRMIYPIALVESCLKADLPNLSYYLS